MSLGECAPDEWIQIKQATTRGHKKKKETQVVPLIRECLEMGQALTLAQAVKKPGDSQFWSGLMEAKEFFFPKEKFKMHNGEQRFWEDWCLGNEPLMEQFLVLFNAARKQKSNCGYRVKYEPTEHFF